MSDNSGTESKGFVGGRVGAGRKSALNQCKSGTNLTQTDKLREAIDLYVDVQNGERVEPANIAKLSAWDMFSVTMYIMSGLAAIFTLAGFDMVVYVIGFAFSGLVGMLIQSYSGVGFRLPERDRA